MLGRQGLVCQEVLEYLERAVANRDVFNTKMNFKCVLGECLEIGSTIR